MKRTMLAFAVMLTALGLHADTTTVYRDSSGRTTGTSTERRNADGTTTPTGGNGGTTPTPGGDGDEG